MPAENEATSFSKHGTSEADYSLFDFSLRIR